MAGGGAQRPFWSVNEPKMTGARSARAHTRGQNPQVYNFYTCVKHLVWSRDVPAGKPAGTVGTPPHILKINAERSRIWIRIQSRIRIWIHYSEVRIRGSGSAPKSQGSPTLLGTKTPTSCKNCYQNSVHFPLRKMGGISTKWPSVSPYFI
jgi:hypothetical protein